GTLQFWLASPIMGRLGLLNKTKNEVIKENVEQPKSTTDLPEKRNPFSIVDYVLIAVVGLIGLIYAFNDPLSKNGVIDVFAFMDTPYLRGQNIFIIFALVLFLILIVSRIQRYEKVIRDRMYGVILLAFFLIFFFMIFEQGATSLVLVARDYI